MERDSGPCGISLEVWPVARALLIIGLSVSGGLRAVLHGDLHGTVAKLPALVANVTVRHRPIATYRAIRCGTFVHDT